MAYASGSRRLLRAGPLCTHPWAPTHPAAPLPFALLLRLLPGAAPPRASAQLLLQLRHLPAVALRLPPGALLPFRALNQLQVSRQPLLLLLLLLPAAAAQLLHHLLLQLRLRLL